MFVLLLHRAPTVIYALSLHDALPISREAAAAVPGVEVTEDLGVIWREAETIVLSLPFPATVEAVLTGEGGLLGSPARHRLVIDRSEEHTSELQSRANLVCRLLLEKQK